MRSRRMRRRDPILVDSLSIACSGRSFEGTARACKTALWTSADCREHERAELSFPARDRSGGKPFRHEDLAAINDRSIPVDIPLRVCARCDCERDRARSHAVDNCVLPRFVQRAAENTQSPSRQIRTSVRSFRSRAATATSRWQTIRHRIPRRSNLWTSLVISVPAHSQKPAISRPFSAFRVSARIGVDNCCGSVFAMHPPTGLDPVRRSHLILWTSATPTTRSPAVDRSSSA